jgi:hypothetical protein
MIPFIIKANSNEEGNICDDEDKNEYKENFILIEFIVIFLLSKCCNKEVYYKHQKISFLILILVETIKASYFLIQKNKNDNKSYDIYINIFTIIYSILYAIYYIYLKVLMKYKFISPYKINFMIGIICLSLFIIIYLIISFIPLGNFKVDRITDLFDKIAKLNAISIILLLTIPFAYGIIVLVTSKIIYDFTIFHVYILCLLEIFIENIFKIRDDIIILISSFCIELIMILVFLEIIELNFYHLNENLKRNIELRGIIDSSLAIEDDYDELDNERITNIKEKTIIN